MAYEFYVTVKGKKQGQFKGESPKARYKDKIPAIRFIYEIGAPRDVPTGQASGKRQHSPVTITKEWGAASPQLFDALVTNEILDFVLFEFVRTNPAGEEEVYYTIRLTDATVSDLKQYANQAAQDSAGSRHELEDISFTYHKIEVENKDTKMSASDNWTR